MGTSVPLEPRWAPDTVPAERALWRWACKQLPDDVLVLPQVALTVSGRGRPTECEIDLVLIDPASGVTVVEVKGGTLEYDGRRAVWRRMGEGAGKKIRDPVAQAKRNRTILRDAIDRSELDVETVALRWAVATPDCRLEAPGEPILPKAQLWDGLAAERLAEPYRATVGALTLGEQPLGTDKASFLASHLRGRTRSGRPLLATAVEDHEARVRFHTESHRNVLKTMMANKHVLVRGAAGTGKTVLALEAAEWFASMGERVLLTCWNVMLAEWLRAEMTARLRANGMDPGLVTDDPTGRVVVSHLVGLARHGASERPEGMEDQEWFKQVLPDALTTQVTEGEFDVVVLDEAQDLSEHWIWAVAGLPTRGGRWLAFTDRQQDLFSNATELAEFITVEHEMRENFRNSRQIVEFASQFGEIESDCLTGDGPPVEFVECEAAEVIERASEVGSRLVKDGIKEEDLAVLYLFHNPYRGRTDELARIALDGGVVTTNSASFKGMERPVVVLGLDHDSDREDRLDEVRRAIYAAATRARSQLTVVGTLLGLDDSQEGE